MGSFLTSRISQGLQQDLGQSFIYGAQVGAQRAATKAAYVHEQEKARILGAARVREEQIKAQADTLKARLDSAEKYYGEAAKYYDDQIGQYENQLLQNGGRYSSDQRQEITRQIDSLRGEKAKILGARSAIFGGPAFQPPQNVSTGVLSSYSPQYEEEQKFEKAKKEQEARLAFLRANAGTSVYNLSGGLTTDYGEWNYSQRRPEQKPPDIMGSFGQKLTGGQINEFEGIRESLPAYLSYFDNPSSLAQGVKLPDAYGNEKTYSSSEQLIGDLIAPSYGKLAEFVKRNLTPEESAIARQAGLGFSRSSFPTDRSALRYMASDRTKDDATRGAASNLYYKLGFGTIESTPQQQSFVAPRDRSYFNQYGIGGR